MVTVNNELTRNNVERTKNHEAFQERQEREETYAVLDSAIVEEFRGMTIPYVSTYLSGPEDEFSLRVQAIHYPEGISYKATLKDRGEMDKSALKRLEISTDISQESYERYANNPQFPTIRFMRAEPLPGLFIDFIEGVERPQVEYESDGSEPEPELLTMMKHFMEDHSNDPAVRKEAIAYAHHHGETMKRSHETLEELTTRMFRDMVATYTRNYPQVVVGISGMSGSGKSSVVAGLEKSFVDTYGEEFRPVILSSDDYHRGKVWLEEQFGAPWTNWDLPVVYDTVTLAADIERLKAGEPIFKRHFDFDKEEVVFDDIIEPSPFVIVEGLFAGSKDLVRQLHYEVPTGIATSIGRDVRRLVLDDRANVEFPDPESRLRYQIETALPTYLEQVRPRRNVFSAHGLPTAERAFMLKMLG